jgi:MFS family permease
VTALRNRQFRRLFLGQSLSFFGGTVLLLSLAILAKELTGSSAQAGAIFLMFALPSLAAPLTGYLIDRLRDDLAAGFRHVRRTPLLLQLMVTSGIAFCVLGFYETIIFAVVDDGLHRPATLVGVLLGVQGAGSVLGGIVSAQILRRAGPGPLVGLGMVAVAAGALLLVSSSLSVVAAGFLLDGLALPWLIVGFMTALQRWTPARLQGRVMAVTYVSVELPQALSIGAGALLISFVDYRAMLAAMGTVVMVCGAVLLARPAHAPLGEEIVPLTGIAAAGAGPEVIRALVAAGEEAPR